jgi:hypothetical protein
VRLNVYLFQGDSLAYHFLVSSDVYGQFAIPEVYPGRYRLLVKCPHTLARLYGTVDLEPGINMISMGTLLEGDLNDDNMVGILDFSLLRVLFGRGDRRGDLNQDGIVDMIDFSLLKRNYGERGDHP